MSGRRVAARRLAASILGLVVALAVAEVGARVLVATAPTPPPRTPPPMGLPRLGSISDLVQPNQDGIWRGARYRTNGRGHRGPDWAPSPAPGTLRIAVTGDSVTMGWGVEVEDAYPSQLERRLDADPSLPDVEVINIGLAGVNAEHAIRRLRRALKVYSADILVYGFTVNDIEGDHYRDLVTDEELERRYVGYNRFGESPSRLLRIAYPPIAEWVDVTFRGAVTAQDEWQYNYFENPAAWRDLVAALESFARLSRKRGTCALVFIHTHLDDLGPGHPYLPMYEAVARAARDVGLPVQESYAHHAWKRPEPLWVRPTDPHPNASGHAILAEALEEGLRALPEACWQPREPAGP